MYALVCAQIVGAKMFAGGFAVVSLGRARKGDYISQGLGAVRARGSGSEPVSGSWESYMAAEHKLLDNCASMRY